MVSYIFTSVTVKTRKPEGSTGSVFMVRMIFAGSYDKNRGDKNAKSMSGGRPSEKLFHFPRSAFLKNFVIGG